ncbi:MAG: hypothetical protein ABL886_06810 [Rhodoglobus sp.]
MQHNNFSRSGEQGRRPSFQGLQSDLNEARDPAGAVLFFVLALLLVAGLMMAWEGRA